jgi:serine/threonine-protein kinase
MSNRSTSRRKGGGRGAGSGRWSIAPKDISTEWNLKGAQTIEVDGNVRPALGRYALFARLGKGAMGIVYFGVNPRLDTEVAIKVLPHALLEQHDVFEHRFLREARFAAQINSPHLVSVLDVDEDPHSGCHFIVMEYVRGLSAAAWRNRYARGAPEADALDVVIAATKGVAAAHEQGIVHRDMKPDNVLIPTDAGGVPLCKLAKVTDLGIARGESTEKSLTGTRAAMGTPGYLSPEQATDAKRADKPSDVFGLGATLYSLLTGKAPFSGSNPTDALIKTIKGEYPAVQEVRADVSEPTARVIARCLLKDPDKRLPDAPALLEELELCKRGAGAPISIATTPPSSPARSQQDTGSFSEDSEAAVGTPEPSVEELPEPPPSAPPEPAAAAPPSKFETVDPTESAFDERRSVAPDELLLLEPEDAVSDIESAPPSEDIFGDDSAPPATATMTKGPAKPPEWEDATRAPGGQDAALFV